MIISEILQQATKEHWAMGHFNVSNLEQIRAIVEAAKECSSPLMIGTSEGEAVFIGYRQAVALVKAFQEEYGIPLFLNADHHKSVESAKKAIDAGYDSVHIDLSALPLEENLSKTREVVDYARKALHRLDVEGEVGYFVTDSSKVYAEVIQVPLESLANPDEAKQFALESGVDRLAVAVGSLHGIAANEPKLDFERIRRIRERVPQNVALVLHGGSGIGHEQIKEAVRSGIANVHISTELRLAFFQGLKKSFASNPKETAPYRLLSDVVDTMKEMVKEKLRILGSCDKMKQLSDGMDIL